MKNETLKTKTLSGIKWSAIDRFSSSIVQFVLGLIVANLLLPSDYGLIGMIAIVIAISQAIVDGGFSQALIQNQNVNDTDFSTIFFFNLGISVVLYFILYCVAPFLADFYNQESLTNLTRVLGINCIIGAFATIQTAYLSKNLLFKIQTKITFTANILSGITAVIFAYFGYGVWSLVIQALTKGFCTSVLLWIFGTWKPNFVFYKNSLHKLSKFGSYILGINLLNIIFDNLYYIVIGKVFSAKELGFYTRAHQFQQFPVSSVTGIIQSVFLPSISTIQNDNALLYTTYRTTIRMIAFIVFPIMITISALAKPIVLVLLNEKWLAVAPMLQIMAIYGMFYPIHALNLNILNVKGKSGLFFRLEVIKKFLIVITIAISYRYGIYAIIISSLFLTLISFPLNSYFTQKLVKYSTWQQIKDFSHSLIIALLAGLLMYSVSLLIPNVYVSLVISAILGMVFYIGSFYLLKLKELQEIKTFVLHKNKLV